MTTLDRGARLLGTAGGQALSAATRTVAALRPAAKPLHPRGDVLRGRLRRRGALPPTGVAWLDERGADEVVVRRSRAIGLPPPLPDIHGLAVRVPLAGGGFADLLFASTGWGRLTRYLLTASRSPGGRPMTTLLPYASPGGPLLLGARAVGADLFELAVAGPRTGWTCFAELDVAAAPGVDQDISFDPLRHRIPGLAQYPLVDRLREPAYQTARDTRSEP